MRRKSHFAGFTLIELMLTIVILTILLAIAVPAFTDIASKNRLKAAAERWSTEIDFARSQAIARNQEVRVNFATGASWCLGLDDDLSDACDCAATPGQCTIDGRQQVVTATDFETIEVQSSTLPDNAFVFDQVRGMLDDPADTGQLVFQNAANQQVALTLSPLGRPSLCNPTGGNVPEYPDCP